LPWFIDIGSWILGSWMLTMLTAPALTLLFLGVVVGLGTAFVWMIWEIEQMSKPHRNSDHFG
jgi:predicted negative regulator of RcsB-dependent stress response